MPANAYDVIVVGARCAGAPTAMLLARKGYRVLMVDRATFPSDTISTHLIHAPGVSALKRWGLLERVVATGCPAIQPMFDSRLCPVRVARHRRRARVLRTPAHRADRL
jgi:2-polyprenyl-6-methoxyphenol hydroxylase-like FAD-dependent oxidoreductase